MAILVVHAFEILLWYWTRGRSHPISRNGERGSSVDTCFTLFPKSYRYYLCSLFICPIILSFMQYMNLLFNPPEISCNYVLMCLRMFTIHSSGMIQKKRQQRQRRRWRRRRWRSQFVVFECIKCTCIGIRIGWNRLMKSFFRMKKSEYQHKKTLYAYIFMVGISASKPRLNLCTIWILLEIQFAIHRCW